jgi:hypothetical protein
MRDADDDRREAVQASIAAALRENMLTMPYTAAMTLAAAILKRLEADGHLPGELRSAVFAGFSTM